MKKVFLSAFVIFALISGSCSSGNPADKTKNTLAENKVIQLTTEVFKKLIFDYDVKKVWKYEGSKPIIIDFYADWCPPCHQLSPLVEEIAKEYEGKVIVYKVNTDQEKALAQTLGISSLPTLLYIPVNGKPHITIGILPKDEIVKNVNEILLTK
jgi:thioredoxin 1